MKTVNFKKWNCNIKKQQYGNGRIALVLVDSNDGQRIAVSTVNLPDVSLEPDEVIIKDYSENSGMVDSLIEAGIIAEPHRFTSSGFVTEIPICKLIINL